VSAPHCAQIAQLLKKEELFEDIVVKKAMERAKFEDLHKEKRLHQPGDRFYNDLKGFSLYKLSYYQCFKCQEPYFGGKKDCEAA
jgi:hypothetical protein